MSGHEQFDAATNETGIALTTLLFRLLRNAQMHDVKALLAQGALASAAASIQELARWICRSIHGL